MYLKVDLNGEPVEHVSDKMKRVRVTGKKALLIKVSAKKGAIIPPHTHKTEQLSTILSGIVRMTVADETIVLERNNVLVIPEGAIHSGVVLEDTEYIDFWPESTELFTLKR